MAAEKYITRCFDYGIASDDEINEEIAKLRVENYTLISFEDDRRENKLRFAFVHEPKSS